MAKIAPPAQQQASRQQIAHERMEILFSQAQKFAKTKPSFAKRCVELARKISKKYRVRLTKRQKVLFCKKCATPLVPGFNASVHLISKKRQLVHDCKGCGNSNIVRY